MTNREYIIKMINKNIKYLVERDLARPNYRSGADRYDSEGEIRAREEGYAKYRLLQEAQKQLSFRQSLSDDVKNIIIELLQAEIDSEEALHINVTADDFVIDLERSKKIEKLKKLIDIMTTPDKPKGLFKKIKEKKEKEEEDRRMHDVLEARE